MVRRRTKLVFQFYPEGKEDDDPQYECDVSCLRCEARSSGGGRCKNRTCLSLPFCWIHTRQKYNVKVAVSGIPNAGKGLFAFLSPRERRARGQGLRDRPVFRPREWIAPITGDLKPLQEINDSYEPHTAPYGIRKNAREGFDGACNRTIGHTANTHRNRRRLNANIADRRGNDNEGYVMWLRATRNINDGDEVFVDYGDDYEFDASYKYARKRV